jgi:hypothetical protein
VRVTIARTGEEVTFMKGKRQTPEQIVGKLREADRLQAEGANVDAVCRHLEISVRTYHRWRPQFKAIRRLGPRPREGAHCAEMAFGEWRRTQELRSLEPSTLGAPTRRPGGGYPSGSTLCSVLAAPDCFEPRRRTASRQ